MKILSFGEVLWDIYPDAKHIGGAVMNFSAHTSRLGAEVHFASAVGRDAEGAEALKLMSRWGIITDSVATTDFETGKCIVTLDNNNTPSYALLQNVAYDHIPCPSGNYDIFCFGSLALRSRENITVVKQLLQNSFSEIFVDINIRPPFISKEVIDLCLDNATILKASDEDLGYIFSFTDLHKAAESIMQCHPNVKLLLVTAGENGAYLYCENNCLYAPAVPAKVVSTVGAGDSFSAAFLVNYLSGKPLNYCLDCAVRLSSFVVSRQAAVPEYNGRDYL